MVRQFSDVVYLATAVAILSGSLGFGCERSSESGSAESEGASAVKEEASELEVRSWDESAIESTNLLEPSESAERRLDLSQPEKYPACRELFEPEGSPAESFLPEEEEPELAVAGCDPEVDRRVDGGRRYVAYRLQREKPGGADLRLLAFDAEGRLDWDYRMDRSGWTENFAANFRSSFVAPLPPRLVCVGTLWEGGTQVACLRAESGEPEWEGELDFWSGIPLQGVETSLFGAEITGITRRYPYSGVEMRRVDFEHVGGHSALYVTDGARLYFVPKEGKPNRLTAYSFETLEPIWRRELPAHPDPGFNESAFAEHELAVVKLGERLVGFDATTGDVRWALEVGDDRPPIAAGPERLYVLVSRSDAPSLLAAVDPESGALDWWGNVPTGTLTVQWTSGMVLIRSVRAIQHVENAG